MSEHVVQVVVYIAPCESCGYDTTWSSTLYEIWNEQGFIRGERVESKSDCPCIERNAA